MSCAFLLACGGGDGTTAAGSAPEDTITDAVKDATGAEPSKDATPCEILDDELVRSHFEIPEGVEISRSPSEYSPHPLCTVSWPKPNAVEIEEKQGEAMREYMTKKMKGEEVDRPSFRTSDEISLTLYEPAFDDVGAARARFEGAMKSLQEGLSVEVQGNESTFQYDIAPVDGVGDEAMWVPKMRQLSVVDGNRIFHVGVNTGGELEADLEKAKVVARAVAAEL